MRKHHSCLPIKARYVLICCWLVASPLYATLDRPKEMPQGNYTVATAYLSKFIEALIDEEDLTGLSIAIVDNQTLVWAKGFGFANRKQPVKASENTLYRVGSISTVLTAAAIMQLIEQNKLAYDRPITDYLPTFSIQTHQPHLTKITLRNLSTHHSGLPLSQFKGMWSEQPASMAQLVASLSHQYTAYPPDYIFAYSNIGYSVLGHLIETISQQPFAQYMQTHLLQPLNMSSSSFTLTPEISKKLATAYKDDDPKQQLPARDIAALGLYSNVIDLAQFVKMIFNQGHYAKHRVLKADSIQQMLSNQRPATAIDTHRRTSFGWQLKQTKLQQSGEMAVRFGATLFFRSRINLLPKHQLGVIILINNTNAFEAIDKLANETLAIALTTKTGIQQPLTDTDKEALEITPLPAPPATAHHRFAQSYATRAGLVTLQPAKNEFDAKVLGWTFRLAPKTQWFNVHYDLLGFIPINLSWMANINVVPTKWNNRQTIVVHYRQNNYLLGIEYPTPVISPIWQQRVGTYIITNRDKTLDILEIESGELRYTDHQLVFRYRLPLFFPINIEIPIAPITDNLARIPGIGTGFNETIQVIKTDKQERLHYSGYELTRQPEPDFFDGFFDE